MIRTAITRLRHAVQAVQDWVRTDEDVADKEIREQAERLVAHAEQASSE